MDQRLQTRLLQAGERLFEEGEPGNYAYIIEEGEIEISTMIQSQRTVLNVLGPGDVFGELALIDGRPRSASAYARRDALLTIISPEQVQQRVESADPILQLLFQVILRHFRSETAHARVQPVARSRQPRRTGQRPAPARSVVPALDLIRMESELRAALDEEQFTLVYQPIVDLATEGIAGFEALLRWSSPTRGRVLPDRFIPQAEATSLILPIGAWVMGESIRALQQLEQACQRPLFISLNIARRQITDPAFFDMLLAATRRVGMSPSQIKLEILERSLFETAVATPWVRRCQALGFPLVLDDFGTGYSSLQYLNEYPIETIKIDQSFVQGLEAQRNSRRICQAIIDLSQALGMTTVAEGVEHPTHVAILQEMDCTYGQGYHFAKPMSLEDAIGLLEAR